MDLGLKSRVAVITGGSRGIGKAIARALAAEGVDLALIARGKEHKTVAEICKTAGVRVLGVPADISKTESVQEAAAAVKS
jgi:3-oxoacyl-[acyl-carrier protein] reductase